MSKGNKVLNAVVDQIIERCEAKGIAPWQVPHITNQDSMNLEYKNPYTGINRWATVLAGFNSPYWVTANQVKKLGGHIKKGQKHTKIIKMALIEKKRKNDKGEEEVYARWVQPVRYYRIFNVEQTEGVSVEKYVDTKIKNIQPCDTVVVNYQDKPKIVFDSLKPVYDMDSDTIHMPKDTAFKSSEWFYNSLFRELASSTGHPDRLNRRTQIQKSSNAVTHGKEELVIEITSAMISNHCGILEKTIDNSTSYVKGWLDALKANPRMLLSSAGMAEKAFKHIVKD